MTTWEEALTAGNHTCWSFCDKCQEMTQRDKCEKCGEQKK